MQVRIKSNIVVLKSIKANPCCKLLWYGSISKGTKFSKVMKCREKWKNSNREKLFRFKSSKKNLREKEKSKKLVIVINEITLSSDIFYRY